VGGATVSLFDFLQVSGTATLSGQLDLSIINGFLPALSDSVAIITQARFRASSLQSPACRRI
jgi:hypothetical protein